MVLRENLEQMYRVNVFAVIEMIQTVSRLMARSGGGSIINMASVTGVIGSPGQVAYSSTKGAVITMNQICSQRTRPAAYPGKRCCSRYCQNGKIRGVIRNRQR